MTTADLPASLEDPTTWPSDGGTARLSLVAVRLFVAALGAILVGYMFLGRGFAHLGFPPLYVGEIALGICLLATGFAIWRRGIRPGAPRFTWLLLLFMALGAARTLPYLGTYGIDALRDATLWGYGLFALMIVVVADRDLVLTAFRAYGWIVPVFALWLPISYNIFAGLSAGIDPRTPGAFVPLVFFKGGDMAVHIVGVVAFLVLGAGTVLSRWSLLWRVAIGVPLILTSFIAGAANRGALLTIVVGVIVLVVLAPRWRRWLPFLLATTIVAAGLTIQGLLPSGGTATPSPTVAPPAAVAPSAQASGSLAATADPSYEPGAASGTSTPALDPSPGSTSSIPTQDALPGVGLPIANGGFELGKPGRPIGWTPFGVGTYRTVKGGALEGSQFVEIDNTGEPYQARLTSSRFTFPDGADGPDVRVSLWARAFSGEPIVVVFLNWYDASGRAISKRSILTLTTGGSPDWQPATVTLVVPAAATSGELVLWEAAGHAAVGIDAVAVRAGSFIAKPPPPKGRPATLGQLLDNILSVFGRSSNQNLEGTKEFRLAWWGTIIDYTVFGNYFWTGKGFGVNLADADGFQSTSDDSLRAPHNSHFTVLARMGVPGFALWALFQAAFGIGLLWALRSLRRAGDVRLAAATGWLLAYWVAMMVDTSFDPYLEGPQGGIWFWTIVGLGLVAIHLASRRRTA